MFKDEKRELWKYYIAQSVRDSLLKAKKVLSEEDEKMLHDVYREYGMMSEYSHGTSWRQKLDRNNFVEHIMNMFSGIYAVLYRMVEGYCSEYVDDFFEELVEIIGNDILEKLEGF
ncbi:hypothetical protein ACTQ50_16305 [Blautia sp. Sow4_E7]|uniref:hypothetical protein n=1 Tax=Blautia sp. Sow4_E7 TaxID=3438749 RepID=UPI003F8F8449